MKFENIDTLYYGMWLMPLLWVFYYRAAKTRRRAEEKFAQPGLIRELAGKNRNRHSFIARAAVDSAVIFLAVLALSRPAWGFYWKEETSRGHDIIFAVDTSKSMLATDIKPDRLSFARSELSDFVKKLKGGRLGLIAFAGDAFLQCPLTADHRGFLLALNGLNARVIPRGGTSLPAALDTAIRNYKAAGAGDRIMIIVTDGENTEGDMDKAVKSAVKERITVNCVGIGTPEGELLIVTDENGKASYVKDENGNPVRSALMEDTLKTLADKTGGIYARATQADSGLKRIYEEKIAGVEKSHGATKKAKTLKERFQIPLVLAVLLIMAGNIAEFAGSRREKGENE